jgi:hypothetical protein
VKFELLIANKILLRQMRFTRDKSAFLDAQKAPLIPRH